MITRLAEGVGKGLFAGLAGTAAMTLVSTLEMKARGQIRRVHHRFQRGDVDG